MVAATDGPSLVEISTDPDAPVVVGTRRLADDAPLRDRASVDLVAAGGHLWVSSPRANTVHAG